MKREYFVSSRGQGEDEAEKGIRFLIDDEELQKVKNKAVAEGHEPVQSQFDASSFALYRLITPAEIISYRCKKCNNTYKEEPKVSVTINGDDRFVTAVYDCNHCGEGVFVTPLHSAEGVPVELIEFDGTGEYKQPTPEAMEELLRKMEDVASKGHEFCHLLQTAERWARKINYSLPGERIQQMQTKQREAYLGSLEKQLPEILEKIQKQDFWWSLEEDETGVSAYEGAGLNNCMNNLFELLKAGSSAPRKPELRGRVLEALYRYQKMFADKRAVLEEEKRGLERTISEVEGDILTAKAIRHKFIDSAEMTRDEVANVKGSVFE